VLELRSRTDTLVMLQEKMQEYMASGVRLAWLINPQNQQVDIKLQLTNILDEPTS
jgi:Uma2 family endonuclease